MSANSNGNHISQQFDTELQEVKDHVLVMGGMAEKLVIDSAQALVNGDTSLAETVREAEQNVDRLQVTIDEECTRVIAKRQPTASDLRLIVAVTKIVGDLERIGDEAEKIAKITQQLAEEGQSPRGYIEVRHISQHVSKMLHDALDAFARLDTDMALAVMREDKSVDAEYKTATRSLMTFMMEDTRNISSVLNVMWVLRALERIGDHARNISEHIIYMVKGKDVRHASLQETKEILEDNK